MRALRRGQVDVGDQDLFRPAAGALEHRPVRAADERLAGEFQRRILANPVTQCREIAVLKCRHTHLGFVQPFRPFADRPCLWNDDEIGPADRQRPHVLREMPIVADRDADAAGPRLVDGSARVARRVVLLLVEAFIVRDVDHPRPAEEAAVSIKYRRRVVTAIPGAFVQICDDYDAQPAGGGRQGLRRRARNRFGQPRHVAGRPAARVKRLERQLGETGELRPARGGRFQRRQTAGEVLGLIRRRTLLDQCDAHGR